MDFKIPTWATRLFTPTLLLFFGVFSSFGQTILERQEILLEYNQQKITSLISEFEEEAKNTALRLDEVSKTTRWNKTEKLRDGTEVSLNDVGEDGTLLYYTTLNDPTNQVSRAQSLYSNGTLNLGLDGSGMQVGVWDSGIALNSHQEFDTRASAGDTSQEVSPHATLVTGNIISSGMKPKARGVAFGAEAVTHNWTRDKIEVAEAAASGLLLSNHSYGIKSDRVPDWYFGAYIKVSQDWDKIMYNAPYYLMVNAAGNSQRSQDNASPIYGKTADGFDLLLGFTTSKNALTVAGANTKLNGKGELLEAEVAAYSSLGPIDDGRIKPDLAGDGSSIFSTTSQSNSSYGTSTGTSMAAPGVTGSLLLLQQYHNELFGHFMKSATLKGLAIHTADDVGTPGPDYKMGWGVLNAKTAAETLQNEGFTTLIDESQLMQGETYSLEVEALGTEDLIISVSWTDVEGQYINRGDLNSTTKALVNDLDIRVIQNNETNLPWKLNPHRANDTATKADNSVDPFERVDIKNAKGSYTIVISHKGELKNGFQDFSLIVSGAKISNCSLRAPENIELGSLNEDSLVVNWSEAEETLFEVRYKSSSEASWKSDLITENNIQLANLIIGEDYEIKVRTICTESKTSEFSEVLRFTFNGTETQILENETFSFSGSLGISVYPNPAVNELKIDGELSQDAVYSIVTSSGTIVKKGSAVEKVSVTDLSSGLYILVVQDYSGIQSTKFYKN
ncbi:S8 family serine peptidase [Flagellimonas meridianipacifica]|uniref:Putative secreted protein (Por secretion system target) n=1 Tax=Flagellimonas meridianipacifica TaxID=1080225 RepID=A0A2T0MHL4_9FLAO|nr:S8 family serine peptidase [Allomuricauda pacifica]PRX57054.1 putative secreted protein (Por secretion system target) [Allomuricauda pacifica]